MSAAGCVSVANALSSNVDVPDGVEQPLVLGDVLGQPARQGIDRGPEALQAQSNVPSLGELEKFWTRFVGARSSVYERSMDLMKQTAW